MRLFVRDKTFYQRILTIALPVSAQQLITAGVNIMDTIMLGRVSETAMSAASMAGQTHNLFQFMSLGMGMGASVLIARYYGGGDHKNLRKTLSLVYRFCLLISLLYTAAIAFFPAPIMGLLTPEADVIAEGLRYLRWSLPCFVLHSLSLVTTAVLRNTTKSRNVPLYTAIAAFFVNIFFNWVFIFGKLGAPAMGVAGAALGTLISRAVECAGNCGFFFLREKEFHFRPKAILEPCGDLLPEFLRISIPVMISDTLLGLGNSVVSAIGGHVSKPYMTATSITTVTRQITTIFNAALGQSAMIITGNTLGEGDTEKAQEQGITFAVLAFLFGLVCCGIFLLASPALVGYYKLSAETHEVAMSIMRAMSFTVIFTVPGSVMTKGVLRGGGDTRLLMVIDVVFLWAISVPLGYLAGIVWHLPSFWIYVCLTIDQSIKAFVSLFRLRSGKWIKKIRVQATD